MFEKGVMVGLGAVLAAAISVAGCGSAATTVTKTVSATSSKSTTTTVHRAKPAAAATKSQTTIRAPLSCPPGETPNAEDVVCVPLTSTTTASIDCAHDGTGGGMPTTATDGAAACEYSLDFSRWCGPAAKSYPITSPPGTFLVTAGYEGGGFAFFRWSDGTETAQQRVC
jgi:hypothetical protein